MRARLIARLIVSFVVTAVLAAACGNSGSSKATDTTQPSSGGSGVTEVTGADLTKKVPVKAPGVTDSEIRVAVVTAATNILEGHYAEFGDGVQAYFDYVNSQGGLYGRTFTIAKRRDDKMFQNAQVVKASLAQDHAFATFVATPLFDSIPDLAAAKHPAFYWNINPETAGHSSLFGTVATLCIGCASPGPPLLARELKLTKVAVLGYGSTASSKDCAVGLRDSFKKYPSAQVVFFDNNLTFAQADLSSQVAQMKNNGAQIVFTCIDQKEALVLGKEIKKQNANIVQNLPNAYDAAFIADNADILEGSVLETQFVPFEKQPVLPELQTLKEWVGKSGKQMRELTIEGWIAALQFVHGLKLAGPDFSQQKVIAALNSETRFDANGLIVPIDWSTQHADPKKHPESRGKWNCMAVVRVHSGLFEPILDQPGKPWICAGGDDQATLITTPDYESFAPAK
jgi:ABC-type branched-subunit amino acid transport system substrate-binding protein